MIVHSRLPARRESFCRRDNGGQSRVEIVHQAELHTRFVDGRHHDKHLFVDCPVGSETLQIGFCASLLACQRVVELSMRGGVDHMLDLCMGRPLELVSS